MRKYKNYTDEDFIKYAAQVKSIAAFLKLLDLKPAGGNYAHAKKNLQRLNVNCDHWTGQGWNKGQRTKDWSNYSKIECLKKHLIKERNHACENCKRTKWFKEIICLEVHHLDGDRTNNLKDNLQLLCPNCHSLTKNWRNRKTK